MRIAIYLLVLFTATASVWAEVVGEEVDYSSGGVVMKGYLAYDATLERQRPGILVVHEWWGQNEYARRRARMLAELGYTALAVDMYGEGKLADHPEDAGKFAAEVKKNLPAARARFEAALKLLNDHETTDPERNAAIGYCFGGGVVLEMARQGVDLDGVVSFHGSLSPVGALAAPGVVKARMLVCHGAEDPFTTEEDITAFKEEMKNAGVNLRFEVYEGAKHSFTNPEADQFGDEFDLPLAYNEEADAESWKVMKGFLAACFAQ